MLVTLSTTSRRSSARRLCVTALEDPDIKPYIEGWIAGGEEARVYAGELPHKLSVLDSAIVLLALKRPGNHGATSLLLIRHEQLTRGLSMLFEFLWQKGTPIVPKSAKMATKIRRISKHSQKNVRTLSRLPLATPRGNNKN